jgi:phenylalanyl-tRNA synthetase beta chain
VHWEGEAPDADFFDLKADVEGLFAHWREPNAFRMQTETNPSLNPSRSAAIYHQDNRIGWLGELHPAVQTDLDLKQTVVLFEINLTAIADPSLPKFRTYSRLPASRRDLAVVVDDDVTVASLTGHIVDVLGDSLRRHEVFDLYRGKGVDPGRKSVGIGLILQGASRTLTDEETDVMIQQVVRRLEQELGATIRN